MGGAPKIVVEDLRQGFAVPESGDMLHVLDRVSFEVVENEVLCIVGPSGCGKTTLLRILAGLSNPLEGIVLVNGHRVSGPGSDRILLFQELHLFHWMTALGNVEFALESRSLPRPDRRARAADVLDFVGLDGFEYYYPHEMSGGMRQKLALARALAADPEVLLMDEPFGSLDVETRSAMESEFLHLREVRRFTTVLVTHDVRQAVFLGDRVLVMSHRPATIKMSVTVPFRRPRQPYIRQTAEFHTVEDSLSKSICSGG